MPYQTLAQITQAGGWLLGLVMLSGCVTTSPSDSLSSLTCPVASPDAPRAVNQDQATVQTGNDKNNETTTQALQKRLQKREQIIAAQTQQIEVLSSQLEALKQIDQDTRRPRKRLMPPAVGLTR